MRVSARSLAESFGQTQGFSSGHLHQGEPLRAGDQWRLVILATHVELAAKPRAFDLAEATVNDEFIAEFCRFAVIDFGAGDDRITLRLRHGFQVHAQFCRQVRPTDFDHA